MVIRYHPQIGHLFVPNVVARIPHERGGYYVRTNSSGFRSDTEFQPQRGAKRRILFFGDSYTAGDGCSNGERYSDLLAEILDVEVFNYGLPGSGTDQQLLILENEAQGVEADLIILCVTVENIERIKVAYRPARDRTTGRVVLVPKPYFTLGPSGLSLQHVPVPLERPPLESDAARMSQSPQAHRLNNPKLYGVFSLADRVNASPRLRRLGRFVSPRTTADYTRTRSFLLRSVGFQPHPDYADPVSPGYKLMQALLERFVQRAAPTPVLIVPLPTPRFYIEGIKPIYQKLFEDIAGGRDAVYTADITRRLQSLDYQTRKKLCFNVDSHLSPFGNRVVAHLLAETITSQGLLPPRPSPITTVPRSTSPVSSAPVEHSSRSSSSATYILGLSCFYHDSAACLIKDGHIVAAAEEERFTRVKNDRRFPHAAANYCLEQGRIDPKTLAAVVYYDNAPLTFERLLHTLVEVSPKGEEAWRRVIPSWAHQKLQLPNLIRKALQYDGLLLHEVHHRSHAASAFFPSRFERAAVLTVDGVGEWATASIGVGNGNRLTLLKQMRFPDSLGLFYSALTQFTGFKVNSGEYKMMGLAPYGRPKYVDVMLSHLIDLKDDGSVELNMEYFGFLSDSSMTNDRFAQLFGGPARKPEDRITHREMDIACSAQRVTEEAMIRMARHTRSITGEARLCLAGGVALNCVANGRILRENIFEDIWIQPAAGDAGAAIGAALDAYYSYFDKGRSVPQTRPSQGGSFLGPEYSDSELRAFLETHGFPHTRAADSERATLVASHLREGKVVGHFSGRAEFGPRSLGARSILADARNSEMQTTLNLKIKYRESFRPFAPTVLAEQVGEYFDLDRESPYMLLVAPVKDCLRVTFTHSNDPDLLSIVRTPRSTIPAVTHIDYSARVQTIARSDHAEFYDVIKAFETATGCAVVVNTSFNVRGEPIVLTPYDAYRCFMRTEMDVLVLGNYVLEKKLQPPWPEPKGGIDEYRPAKPVRNNNRLEALDSIYAKSFLRSADRVKRNGYSPLVSTFRSRGSCWEEYTVSQSAAAVFSIPPDLDCVTLDPKRAAAAITSFWSSPALGTELQPLIAQLIATSQRLSSEDIADEEVPDSLYAMF
jgi:carbamoyltransferase